MKGTWTVEDTEDYNTTMGTDLEEDLAKALCEEIDKEILKKLQK